VDVLDKNDTGSLKEKRKIRNIKKERRTKKGESMT